MQTVSAKAWTDLVLQEARTAYIAGILSPSLLSPLDYAQLPTNDVSVLGVRPQDTQRSETGATNNSISRVLRAWSEDNSNELSSELPTIPAQPVLTACSVSASTDVLYTPAPRDRCFPCKRLPHHSLPFTLLSVIDCRFDGFQAGVPTYLKAMRSIRLTCPAPGFGSGIWLAVDDRQKVGCRLVELMEGLRLKPDVPAGEPDSSHHFIPSAPGKS